MVRVLRRGCAGPGFHGAEAGLPAVPNLMRSPKARGKHQMAAGRSPDFVPPGPFLLGQPGGVPMEN